MLLLNAFIISKLAVSYMSEYSQSELILVISSALASESGEAISISLLEMQVL